MSEDEWTLIKLMAEQLDVQNKMLIALTQMVQGMLQLQQEIDRDIARTV